MIPNGRALLALALLAAPLFSPSASAVLPTAEMNDVLWCVDQTSRTVQDLVHQHAAWLADTYDANYRAIKCKLHQRPPIELDGSDTVGYYATLNTVVAGGSGHNYDPFVIENWEIVGDASAEAYAPGGSHVETPAVPLYGLSHGVGITIKNTADVFVVRKVYVHGFREGIHLENAPYVRVEGSVIVDNARGVVVEGQSASVDRNLISAREKGVEIQRGHHAFVRDNTIEITEPGHHQHYGVYVAHKGWGSAPTEVLRNHIMSADAGVGYLDVAWGWIGDNRVCAPRPYDVRASTGIAVWGHWC